MKIRTVIDDLRYFWLRLKGWPHERRMTRRMRREAAIVGCLTIGDRHALDIMWRLGASSGYVYPALARLEGVGVIESQLEVGYDGPPRRSYRLSAQWLGRNDTDPTPGPDTHPEAKA